MANTARKSLRAFAGIATAATVALASPLAADVKKGVDAWSEGDYATAVAEWRGPAANGDADAIFNLAQAYRLGRGVDADLARAQELYAEAANRGHVKAADNYGLLLFQQGEQETAMPLIRNAADRGDPRAQYILGLAHFNADYAPKDWVRAYALMTLSNGAGLPQASAALSQMDQYVPLAQRQQAQSLARQIEADAVQARSAQLAAVDLQTPKSPTSPTPAAATGPARPAPQPVAATSQPNAQPARQSPSGNWRVQLGAFGVAGNADRLWGKLADNPALRGTRKELVPGGNVTRLLAVGFTSRAAAQSACDTLKQEGQGCLVKGTS